MALIKNAQAGTMAREAVVLDLGDLYRQGESMRERAAAEAQQTIDAAGIEADRIIEEAMARGFEEGRAAGAEQGRAAGFEAGRNEAFEEQFTRLQKLSAGWAAALHSFLDSREALLRDARHDVVELSIRIAERILKREIEHDDASAARQLEAALGMVLDPTILRIEVSHRDREAITEALPGLLATLTKSPHADISESPEIEPGGCRVRTDAGVIDGQIGAQLDRLVHELLTSGASPRWEKDEKEPSAETGVDPAP